MVEKREGFYLELLDLLKQDPQNRFYADNGKDLLRNKVYECAMKMDKDLIKLLLSNNRIKEQFFTNIDDLLVFDKTAFGWAINNKAFLQDSYTRFKNNIGLIDSNEQFISSKNDVVLSFPYKDCVLEGGQTKEDQKREEIYYNELLAPDDVDRLLAPKVFTNMKRYTKDGEENITSFEENDNLLIKGNNLLALSSILKRYEGKIKCIYIDPPYNTGSDSFNYNDNFNHSTWLVFMKNRLLLAKKLLSEDGSIFVQCDDYEDAYLKVLMDEIFGRENFRNKITWKRRGGSANPKNRLNNVTDYILWFSKSDKLLYNPIFSLEDENTQKYIKERFTNIDENGRKYMKSPLQSPNPRPNLMYEYKGYRVPTNGWSISKEVMEEWDRLGKLCFPKDKSQNINRKIYLDEYQGQPISSLWTDIFVINPMSKESVDFVGQKPEALIQRILEMCSNKNDIILDFNLGSGTTGTVAQKINRQWIGIEQLDYGEIDSVKRIQNVLKGDNTGISKAVNWQGGGSFVYCELKELNQKYIDEIMSADNDKLVELYPKITESEFVSYKVDINKLKESEQDFKDLSTEDKRRFLIEVLDKNQLYVNYCDMEDEDLAVTEEEKAFTKSFYGDV